VAIVMLRAGIDAQTARERLEGATLREALGE